MKKILLAILCLFCITSNYSYGLTQQEYEKLLQDKQIILQNFNKDNDKILTKDELKRGLNNTESEIFYIHRIKNADHVCYSNGVIKQTKIISSDGSITYHYFNIYGIEVGSLTYKNNKLIASTRPISDTESQKKIVSTNSNTSSVDRNYSDSSSAIGNGRIRTIGNMPVSYNNGRISRIGDMPVSYNNGRMSSVGNMSISH